MKKLKFGVLFLCVAVAVCVILFIAMACYTKMPGTNHGGPFLPVVDAEKELAAALKSHVVKLAGEIGERHLDGYVEGLRASESYIETVLRTHGYQVKKQSFEVEGTVACNLEAELLGTSKPEEILVVGAHYDSAEGTPAANDNGTGVAATLELARLLRGSKPNRTIRFVLFVNEEPPFFQTDDMGSLRYARRCFERKERVFAMISLDTIGFYSDEPGSQHYPRPLASRYPDTGNFIGFVGNLDSKELVRQCVEVFRDAVPFPAEGAAMHGAVTGIGWSDHWSFWQIGTPAVMITDTALFRYPHYHEPTDTPDKIDYVRTARVTLGAAEVVEILLRDGIR